MTRKRIKHVQIANEDKRNHIFKKRAEGLLKKANQLCILCGIKVAVVIHKHGGESNAIVWPSHEEFHDQLRKFLECLPSERTKKMVTHDMHVKQTLSVETDNILKARKRVAIKEAHQLLHNLTLSSAPVSESLDSLNLYQLNGLKLLTDEMINTLKQRWNELSNDFGKTPVEFLARPPNAALQCLPPPFQSGAAGSVQLGGRGVLGYMGMRPEPSSAAARFPQMMQNYTMMRNDQVFARVSGPSHPSSSSLAGLSSGAWGRTLSGNAQGFSRVSGPPHPSGAVQAGFSDAYGGRTLAGGMNY